jgi:hypothetical protein
MVIGGVCSSALGGTIGFTPGTLTIDPSVDATVVDVTVFVADTSLASYDAANVQFGSDDIDMTGFTFATFTRFFETNIENDTPLGPYPQGWQVGYFGLPARVEGDIIGTLTIDVTGLNPGDYTVVVNSGIDQGFSSLASGTSLDLMNGSLPVTIVPEPATLGLLGLGMIGLIRRRLA